MFDPLEVSKLWCWAGCRCGSKISFYRASAHRRSILIEQFCPSVCLLRSSVLLSKWLCRSVSLMMGIMMSSRIVVTAVVIHLKTVLCVLIECVFTWQNVNLLMMGTADALPVEPASKITFVEDLTENQLAKAVSGTPKCGLCRCMVSVHLYVCLSCCPSRSCIVSPSDCHTILVFPYQTLWQYSNRNLLP